MQINRRYRLLAMAFVTAFVFMAIQPGLSVAVDFTPPADLNVAPYIDKLVWKVIEGEDQLVLAIQSGEVDLHEGFIEPSSYAILDPDPDIEVVDDVLRAGYGHIKMNTAKSPMNWTEFRRAFAFAYDKAKVQTDIFEGLSILHDSVVVATNTLFSIEEDLLPHYYNPEVAIGNQLLDDAGFTIDPVSGDRLDPNGNPIHIVIGYSPSSPAIAGGSAQVGVDALRALHISAETNQENFNTYLSNLYNHGDYDMIFYATSFYGTDLDWMDREFGSYYSESFRANPTNFRNETVDAALAEVLAAVTYEDAYEACAEVQRLIHYEVPSLIIYENMYLQAYRTDKFTGHLMDQGRYINGPWSLGKIRLLDGTFGGTLNVLMSQEPDTFNFFNSNSAYSGMVNNELVQSLYDLGPDLKYTPVLAESYLEETHATNDDVPVGHHRFTFDLIQNATWSDGTPFTAEDVAFSVNYFIETGPLGNVIYSAPLVDVVAAYAPSTYRFVIEFSRESYWNFGNAATTVIPKHIFEPGAGIGYEGWNQWNPQFNPADPHVTMGPFTFTDMEAGEFYELTHNPTWAYYPQERLQTPTTTPPTTTTPPPFDATLAIVAGAVGAAVVILVGGFVLLRQK